MEKIRKMLIVALVCLVSLVALSFAAYNHVYHMSGTVGVNESVLAYLDEGCTSLLPDNKDWGNILDTVDKSIWLKNMGNVQVDVTLTIGNLVGCTVTLDPSSFTLNIGATRLVTMTITPTEAGGTPISWDLTVSATKSTT